MSAQPSQALEVFFSYAHRDEALRDELVKHLSPLQRQGVITAWHDRKVTAETEWAGAIDDHLQSAQIILMLVSADFMASNIAMTWKCSAPWRATRPKRRA